MNIHRHGEVILKQIESLPESAKLVTNTKEHIVGHSETGHHHVLTADLAVYELDGEMYLDVKNTGTLTHKKVGADIHKSQQIQAGKYKVNIKRQFDYFTGLISKVRD